MSETRMRHTALFDYPGLLFPESISRELPQPTLAAALAVIAENGSDTFFTADGWYAVTIVSQREKRFTAVDGEETWRPDSPETRVLRLVVGEQIHVDDIPDTSANQILRANLRSWSESGYAVRTRRGNWQPADAYDQVLSVEELAQVAP